MTVVAADVEARARLSLGTQRRRHLPHRVGRHEDFPVDGEFFRIDAETGRWLHWIRRMPVSAGPRWLSARFPRVGSDNVAVTARTPTTASHSLQ